MNINSRVIDDRYHSIYLGEESVNKRPDCLLCNFKKQNDINEKIEQRLKCDETIKPLIPPRPTFIGKCIEPKNQLKNILNIDNKKLDNSDLLDLTNQNNKNKNLPKCCKINGNCGGNGHPMGYLSNIDVDSYVRNLHKNLNNCKHNKQVKKLSCDDCMLRDNEEIINTNFEINKCVDFKRYNKCNKNIEKVKNQVFPRPYDTLYDLSSEMPCFDCEMYWNNRTKRKTIFNKDCSDIDREKNLNPMAYSGRETYFKAPKSKTYDTCPRIESSFTRNFNGL
jgi:hypothetical protein